MARDLRPIYTAVNEADARQRLEDFDVLWGERYPAIRRLWDSAWSEFVPFLDYAVEIRKVIYSTDEIVNPSRRVVAVASGRRSLRRPVRRVRRELVPDRVAA